MLEADDTNNLTWYIGIALVAHSDMKSHAGAVFKMEKERLLVVIPSKN